MSRLGKRPITVPNGVKVSVNAGTVLVEGPKGKLTKSLPTSIKVEVKDGKIHFERPNDEGQSRADHGLVRSVINNMVKGASQGFQRVLISVGVGYRMSVQGNKVNLSVGYSHPVVFELPQGVTAQVQDQTKLTLSGADKELLGSVADKIRKVRPPEPYKGKGIRYEGEQIQLKEGKSAAGSK
ncbi:MAG: 50S ribosomal protein L6 [Deltaproteobacteria bacterium CG11_big_fil_rev_8_21_14_0_20_45_16]|nr:MAG: 50S ribosomal protein L6 [Deltaproteobacteria bacterium CG11_big_fil_rev_8_21_14_0_20_45_16]